MTVVTVVKVIPTLFCVFFLSDFLYLCSVVLQSSMMFHLRQRLFLILLCLSIASFKMHGQETPRRIANIGIGHHMNPTDGSRVGNLVVGLFGYVDSIRGLQINLLNSGAGKEMRGVQLSGIASVTGITKGLQAAMISTITTRPLYGVQLAGVTTVSPGIACGMQLSGVANIADGVVRGVQISGYNYASILNGVQVGLINVADSHPRGVQVGLFNFSRDTIGCKFGLVSINPSTRIDLMTFAGSSTKINLALRFKNRSTYSIIGFGTHYIGFDARFSGALYYRLGQYFDLSPRWSVSSDVGYYHIETFEAEQVTRPRRLYALQLHVNVDYRINKILGLYISTGYGMTRFYRGNESYRNRALVEGGLLIHYK